MNWGNQLGGPIQSEKRQADEKVGEVDCYVCKSELNGRTRTIWFGKQDFLIHQVRVVTNAEALKAAMEQAAKANPEFIKNLPKLELQSITTTETHNSIVVNKDFKPSDFVR